MGVAQTRKTHAQPASQPATPHKHTQPASALQHCGSMGWSMGAGIRAHAQALPPDQQFMHLFIYCQRLGHTPGSTFYSFFFSAWGTHLDLHEQVALCGSAVHTEQGHAFNLCVLPHCVQHLQSGVLTEWLSGKSCNLIFNLCVQHLRAGQQGMPSISASCRIASSTCVQGSSTRDGPRSHLNRSNKLALEVHACTRVC